jgi:hypothetical protein
MWCFSKGRAVGSCTVQGVCGRLHQAHKCKNASLTTALPSVCVTALAFVLVAPASSLAVTAKCCHPPPAMEAREGGDGRSCCLQATSRSSCARRSQREAGKRSLRVPQRLLCGC